MFTEISKLEMPLLSHISDCKLVSSSLALMTFGFMARKTSMSGVGGATLLATDGGPEPPPSEGESPVSEGG